MKKIYFAILFFGLINLTHAQEEGKFRAGLDFGVGIGSGSSGGILFAIEPKYNLKHNLNVGLRFQGATIIKDMYYVNRQNEDFDATIQASSSFMAVSDYYFHKEGGNSFAPFIGGGLGFFNLQNVYFSASEFDNNATVYNTKSSSVFGGMIRGGFEWGKFRMSAEYNFVPETDLQNTMGFVIGKAKNNYFGLNLGFYLGGGKWQK